MALPKPGLMGRQLVDAAASRIPGYAANQYAAVTGAAGSGGAGGIGGGLQKLLGGGTGGIGKAMNKWGPYAMMAYAAMQYAGGGGQAAQTGLQIESLENQAEALNPKDMMYQAMMSQSQDEEKFARQQLVNQLMGTTGPSRLARGEERI